MPPGGLSKLHDIISYESRSAIIWSSCSCVTTSGLNWAAGLSLSQANTLAAAEAKSLSLPLQFRGHAGLSTISPLPPACHRGVFLNFMILSVTSHAAPLSGPVVPVSLPAG